MKYALIVLAALLLLSQAAALALSGPSEQGQANIAPGSNLVVEGIPQLPSALGAEVDTYTNFRQAFLTSWHPLKRQMLIATRFADTDQIHEVTTPLGARHQLTFFKDKVAGGSYEPKNGDYLVFARDSGGNEFFQLYRYDFASKAVTLLTDGKSRNTGAVWSKGGDRLAYGSTRRNGADVDIYVMNPRDPAKSDRRLSEFKGGGWQVLDWSPDDSKLLVLEEISANESYLWLVDVGSGQKKLLTPKDSKEKVFYADGVFDKSGERIYVVTDRDSEFKRLALIDLKTLQPEYLTSKINWDVDEMALSWDGRLLAFVTNEDGLAILHLLDCASAREKPAFKLPPGQIGDLKWHKNNRDLGFVLTGARSPADAYSLDVTSGRCQRWTESETGGIDTSNFSEPELVHWKSFDGKTISGFLYKPPAKFTGKRPLIVNIHGGPEGQSRPFFLGRLNYFLNELGVAIIFPNVRGSSGYGKTFLKLDNGFARQDSYKDIAHLFDWVKTRSDLDPERIMVTGGSYGGHMTLAIACFYPERISCALDVVGPSNLVTFLENTEDYRRDLRRVEYGDERDPAMRQFLLKIAPTANAGLIRKPLFIVQGKNDPRVPASESRQMADVVKANGVPVWFLMANDEGHGFAKKKNADFQLYATVMFIRSYLLN